MEEIDDSLARALARIDDFEAVQSRVSGQDLVDAVAHLQESVGLDDEARARIGEWLGERGSASRRAPGHLLLGVIVGLMAAELRSEAEGVAA